MRQKKLNKKYLQLNGVALPQKSKSRLQFKSTSLPCSIFITHTEKQTNTTFSNILRGINSAVTVVATASHKVYT